MQPSERDNHHRASSKSLVPYTTGLVRCETECTTRDTWLTHTVSGSALDMPPGIPHSEAGVKYAKPVSRCTKAADHALALYQQVATEDEGAQLMQGFRIHMKV